MCATPIQVQFILYDFLGGRTMHFSIRAKFSVSVGYACSEHLGPFRLQPLFKPMLVVITKTCLSILTLIKKLGLTQLQETIKRLGKSWACFVLPAHLMPLMVNGP